jgi:hypothetical protein
MGRSFTADWKSSMWRPGLLAVAILMTLAGPSVAQIPPHGLTDYVRRTVLPLRDGTGAIRFNLVVVTRGSGPADTLIEDLQGHVVADLNAPPPAPRPAASIQPVAGNDHKADSATQTDIQSLQRQIDILRNKLNDTISVVNGLR